MKEMSRILHARRQTRSMVSAHCDRLAGGTSRRFMALCPPREKWEDHRALRMKVDV